MRRKLTVAAMTAMSMFVGMAQASVIDDFESGTLSSDWVVSNIATIQSDGGTNNYAHVTGATVNGDVLGGYFGADATNVTAEFYLSFDFRFTDTDQRQMCTVIGSHTNYSVVTQNYTGNFLNFIYDGVDNVFKAHNGGSWVYLSDLPTDLADATWNSVTIIGRDFGTTNASYDVTVNGTTQTNITVFQNPTWAETVKADGFDFNDRWGDNPGFDVDNVVAMSGTTGPTNTVPSVAPNIQSIEASGGMVNLSWDSEPSVSYSVRSRSDLLSGSWNVVTNGIPSGGANTSVSVPGTEDVQFYSISGE